MATQFHIHLLCVDQAEAEAVCTMCFERIDELENKLSRFIPDSDITRINRLKEGQDLMIDYETYECFKTAIEVNQFTNGAFDIGVGEFMNIFRGHKEGILSFSEQKEALKTALNEKLEGSIYLDPDEHRIYCLTPGIQFDLGALGKGYTVDIISDMLKQEGYNDFSVTASDSTVLVHKNNTDNESFDYKLTASEDEVVIKLYDESVSASGTYWQGNHIFDPRSGKNTTDLKFERLWVSCTNAALSDAFSTGLFLLSEKEVEEVVNATEVINWAAYSQTGKIRMLTKI